MFWFNMMLNLVLVDPLWNISTLLWGNHCALEPLTIWLSVVRADFYVNRGMYNVVTSSICLEILFEPELPAPSWWFCLLQLWYTCFFFFFSWYNLSSLQGRVCKCWVEVVKRCHSSWCAGCQKPLSLTSSFREIFLQVASNSSSHLYTSNACADCQHAKVWGLASLSTDPDHKLLWEGYKWALLQRKG